MKCRAWRTRWSARSRGIYQGRFAPGLRDSTRGEHEPMSKQVSICVIGSGYVGLVAAVCFAEMGHKVTCVDNDEAKVKTLCSGGVPIYEEHLPELLAKHLNRGVEFTTDLGGAVERSEAIFIAVGTPQGDS